jgi:hypothetical protein
MPNGIKVLGSDDFDPAVTPWHGFVVRFQSDQRDSNGSEAGSTADESWIEPSRAFDEKCLIGFDINLVTMK